MELVKYRWLRPSQKKIVDKVILRTLAELEANGLYVKQDVLEDSNLQNVLAAIVDETDPNKD